MHVFSFWEWILKSARPHWFCDGNNWWMTGAVTLNIFHFAPQRKASGPSNSSHTVFHSITRCSILCCPLWKCCLPLQLFPSSKPTYISGMASEIQHRHVCGSIDETKAICQFYFWNEIVWLQRTVQQFSSACAAILESIADWMLINARLTIKWQNYTKITIAIGNFLITGKPSTDCLFVPLFVTLNCNV